MTNTITTDIDNLVGQLLAAKDAKTAAQDALDIFESAPAPKPKITQAKVNITVLRFGPDGFTRHQKREVDGYVLADHTGLAVTPCHHSRQRYVVTHTPSGLAVSDAMTKAKALSCMIALYALGVPWWLKRRHLLRLVGRGKPRYEAIMQVMDTED